MLMTIPFSGEQDFECIESSLGELIWRIDDPTTSSELLDDLELHVQHCAACRLQMSLQREVASGLRDGRLTMLAPSIARPSWAPWSSGVGAMALAACLALIFILPPVQSNEALVMRGDDSPVVVSPLPDVVIHDRTPQITWTKLDRATQYRVSVRDVDGDYQWSGETTSNSISISENAALPSSSRLRIRVETIPAHAAPDGGLQSSFRTGDWREFVDFRLGSAPRSLRFGALLGSLGLLVGLTSLLRFRRW
jgi:hypothetical protein